MHRWFILLLLTFAATGCSLAEPDPYALTTHDEFEWHGTRLTVGMPLEDALHQCRGAVHDEAYDPASGATILGTVSADQNPWVFRLISPEPVGPTCIVRVTFEDRVLSLIEVGHWEEQARREAYGYPNRDTLTWKDVGLELGMTRREVLDELRANLAEEPYGSGVAALPTQQEAEADVWRVGFVGDRRVGNGMWVRLSFDGEVLSRIQVTAVLQ